MAIELYNDGEHRCLMFEDSVDESADAVQANQFLIVDGDHAALIDPGGNIAYKNILMARQQYWLSKSLDFILASHADPDIIASLSKWFVQSDCKLVISRVWARFAPHFCSKKDQALGRIVPIPDRGMDIQLGNAVIKALPAHFLHSEGNFQFYDTVSKVLFSGDMGASMVSHQAIGQPVADFDAHLPSMEGFHRRYMSSNKVCRYWVNMVRTLDIDAIVPQHGCYFKGEVMVNRFLDWVEQLDCGVDLVTQSDYRVP